MMPPIAIYVKSIFLQHGDTNDGHQLVNGLIHSFSRGFTARSASENLDKNTQNCYRLGSYCVDSHRLNASFGMVASGCSRNGVLAGLTGKIRRKTNLISRLHLLPRVRRDYSPCPNIQRDSPSRVPSIYLQSLFPQAFLPWQYTHPQN